MSEVKEFKRDWDIEEEKHKIYSDLIDRTQKLSPFRGKNMADVFIYAMALGFYNKKKRVLEGKKRSSIPFTVLLSREWLINTIAIADVGRFEVLLDKDKIAQIGEEYANGGIDILNKMIFGGEPGDAHKRMEAELRSILSKTKKDA